jgi:DNA-binding response OmpR family regulator
MYSVLLVTGDRNFREVATRVLTAAGFATVPATHTGHALLSCLGPRQFDVLVIEQDPADARGVDVLQLLRHQPEMRVVRIGLRSEGADLVRPFIADDLLAAVSIAAGRTSSAWF